MKTFNTTSKKLFGGLCAALLGLCSISVAHAQIFVTNYSSNAIGEYNLDGTTINASLVSGLDGPEGLALSGNDLYVANLGNGRLANTTPPPGPQSTPRSSRGA